MELEVTVSQSLIDNLYSACVEVEVRKHMPQKVITFV